jgi:ABC-type cobalamin/Fe3+-siderophores transport system ATPase subunit
MILIGVECDIVFEDVSFRYPEGGAEVVRDLSLEIPRGIVSLVGQNGTGKSTLLLLAAGSLLPTSGRVLLKGVDTRELGDEEERHRLASLISQNMEFETTEPVSELLAFVMESGFLTEKRRELIEELVEVFELAPFLDRRTQDISKGELQRTILAFSLLYGSPVLVMDEPIFALEDRQKQAAMAFLAGRAREKGLSLLYSVHELEISRDYSDFILLFTRAAPPRLGRTAEVFTRDTIEAAYEAPFDTLKRREKLYRMYLTELLKVRKPEAGGS